jgi:hypothetical protein
VIAVKTCIEITKRAKLGGTTIPVSMPVYSVSSGKHFKAYVPAYSAIEAIMQVFRSKMEHYENGLSANEAISRATRVVSHCTNAKAASWYMALR